MLRAACVGLAATALLTATSRGSLYQPDDAIAVPVKADGTGEALPFQEFKRRLATLTNALDEKNNPTDRQRILARIEKAKGRDLPPLETAALAADLLRVGKPDEALNRLKPKTRDRNPNYFVLATLGQVHAARGEWQQAIDYHTAALFDSEMPPTVKGLQPAQRDWQAKLDRDYVLHYYQLRKHEAAARPRPAPEAEEPDPLFPVPERNNPQPPVRFVTSDGGYEPGNLSPAEKAKLPPDAIAVVQQLLLWFPGDTRLYWLLGELYAAEGELDAAQAIFNELVAARQYSNRKVLMDHRQVMMGAVEAKQKAEEQAEKDAYPVNLKMVAIYFGVVAVIALLAGGRAVWKRARGDCGPVG